MKKLLLFPVVLFLWVSNACMHTKKTTASQASFAKNVVVAHRGAWKKNKLPENSIASLKEAIRLGCAGSEFDVYLTADDSLVINHDADYAGRSIEKNTYSELAKTTLSNGEMLPTLHHYLQTGMQQNKTMLVLEIKPSAISRERGQYVAQKVVEMVKHLKAEPWIMYISFDYHILTRVLELEPGAKTAYLSGDKTPAQLVADKIWGADYHYDIFKKNSNWIAEAQQIKLNLNAWTVNKEADMQWFISNNFDYITTNEPELLFDLINKAGK